MQQGAPTALWWKQLATAVVFGLGLATFLTLIVTPAALAARVWAVKGFAAFWAFLQRRTGGRENVAQQDGRLRSASRKTSIKDIIWGEKPDPSPKVVPSTPRAAE